MNKNIYFDNAASAIINPKAAEAAAALLYEPANPSSKHKVGIEARKIIDNARAAVARSSGYEPCDIIFVSSGSEANNTAIFSAFSKKRSRNRVITTKTEHPSVLRPLKRLEELGAVIDYIPVREGDIDWNTFERSLDGDVFLACFSHVNSQTGTIFNIQKIYEIINSKNLKIHLHCDAVQSYLKVPKNKFNLSGYCDTAAVSSHKIGGIKGTAALCIKKGTPLTPLVFGGSQESGLRAGTENLYGIAAFGAAVSDYLENPGYNITVTGMRKLFIELAKKEIGSDITVYEPENHVDSIVNVSVRGLLSEHIVNGLEEKNIFISASSACSPKTKGNSVLEAFGLDNGYINSAVRVAFSPFNTEDEVIQLIMGLKDITRYRLKK